MIVSTVLLASKVKGLPSTTSAIKDDKEVLTVAQAGSSFLAISERNYSTNGGCSHALSWRAWKGLVFFQRMLLCCLLPAYTQHCTWLKCLDGRLYLSLRFESILLLDSLLLLLTLVPVVVGSELGRSV